MRFGLLVIATGVAAGFGAVGLEKLLKAVQHLAWPREATFLAAVQAASPLHRVAMLGLAGLLVTAATYLARAPMGGHGTGHILEAIWHKAGQLPLGATFVRGVLSIVAVALGVSLGREGALLQTGAATGGWLGQRFKLPQSEVRLLVACGASAGIAAAYNVPIGAAVFGLEVLLGSLALELFGPVVTSCVVATLISRLLLGAHPSYRIPHYELLKASHLAAAFALGPALGAASAVFVRTVDAVPRLAARVPARLRPLLPLVATLGVGLVAVRFPQVLGNGYDSVNAALLGKLPLMLLLLLPLLKLLTSATSAGFGVPGGLFTPSLFFGGLFGGGVGLLLERLFPGQVPPGAYALLGMGGGLAGTTHAAISAVLLIFELTGDYGLVLPLMLTCAVAAGVSRHLQPHSLYAAGLKRRNVEVPETLRPEWLRATQVSALGLGKADAVAPDTRFGDVVLHLLSMPGSDLYVTGTDGEFLGILALDALKGHIPDASLLSMVVASDVMDRETAPLHPDLSLAQAARRFAATELGRLPVVDRATGRLLGSLDKGAVLRRGRF